MSNNRSALSEMHQRIFCKPLELSVIGKEGPDHYPTITVQYETSWGVYTKKGAPGQNQKTVAEELAAEIIIKNMGAIDDDGPG
jgi:dsRNA-specific ribonuclease